MITIDLPSRRAASSGLPRQVAALRRFLARAQRAAHVPGKVSILLTTDSAIRRLNRDFRSQDKSTDVLSFPALPSPFMPFSQVNSRQLGIAGDLAISVDTASRQARRFRHSLNEELRILMLHGLLHLGGHDHESDRGEMAALEDQLRRRFRLPVALIGRVEDRSAVDSPRHKRASARLHAQPSRKRARL